jgi:hypothetical protein
MVKIGKGALDRILNVHKIPQAHQFLTSLNKAFQGCHADVLFRFEKVVKAPLTDAGVFTDFIHRRACIAFIKH